MAFTRRPRFRRRRTARRRFRPKSTRRAFKRSFRKRRGFVKNYKRKGFVGHRTPRWGKIFSSLNNKAATNWSINQTFTNVNTAGTDNAWIYMPVGALVMTSQAEEAGAAEIAALPYNQFSGGSIWLRGIKLDLLVAAEASQDFYFRILCFWTTPDVDIMNIASAGTPWNLWANTGVSGNTIGGSKLGQGVLNGFQFLDLPYAPASAYGNFSNITTRPNPTYPGKLLFDFKKKLTCTANIATSGGNPSFHFSQYFPFNKLFTFATYPFTRTSQDTVIPNLESLDTAPNFGTHGQPIFVIYYANTIDIPAAGTEASIAVAGTSRVYFKDIQA